MAYETDTLRPLHGLTPEGETAWRRFLEERADEILFRHSHPIRYLARKMLDIVRSLAAEDAP